MNYTRLLASRTAHQNQPTADFFLHHNYVIESTTDCFTTAKFCVG